MIETYTGRTFDYAAPAASDVHLTDIARALSQLTRFAGHTNTFYSVAEHSVLVAYLLRDEHPDLVLPALLHDAHEAYMGDLPSPLKAIVGPAWKRIAQRIDVAVAGAFGLDSADVLNHPAVKAADQLALVTEAVRLKHSGKGILDRTGVSAPPCWPAPWSPGLHPTQAEAAFYAEVRQALRLRGLLAVAAHRAEVTAHVAAPVEHPGDGPNGEDQKERSCDGDH